jgi:F420-0:gamma-glutamyl ligase
MAKQQGKGVYVGAKIKVGFPKTGKKQDGSMWQLFMYKENKKNPQTGEYDELGKYTIFVNNPQENLKNGDYVTIKNITKSLIEKNVVNNKEYINISLSCDIKTNEKTQNENFNVVENKVDETLNFDDTFTNTDDFPF